MATFNRNAWSRFLALARPVFHSEIRWRAGGVLALLLTLLLSVSGLNVVNSYVGRDFITAVTERNADSYPLLAFLYIGVFASTTIVAVLARFTEERLGLMWRRWLTGHLLDRYLSSRVAYRLNNREDIDNPDQRLSEDVRNFTVTTLSFFVLLTNSTSTALAFLGVLWSITPLLFLVAVGYAVFGSVMTVLLGHRLVGLDNLQFKREADFRYELVQVRMHAEELALTAGERHERHRLGRRLWALVDNYRGIIAVNRNLGFFTVGYGYLVQLIPILIAAPLYLRGEQEFGVVTQSAMAFAQVVTALSLIVVQFQNISAFAAVIGRLGSLGEAIESAAAPAAIPTAEDVTRLAYEGLTLRTPKEGRVLVRDLWLEVPRGRRLLIDGPNGAGKSALVRATLGIWEEGEGRIVRPPRSELMFLPQRPYTGSGTLRDLLIPPDSREVADAHVLDALRAVDFEAVVTRVGGLDAERDWYSVLSPGEQQVLAFARLLMVQPRFAFLDDAAHVLGRERARQLYHTLAQTDITYISVTAHPDLPEYHDALLEIHDDGSWELLPLRSPGDRDRQPLRSAAGASAAGRPGG
jgi:putative ATP-binding cassette transporter